MADNIKRFSIVLDGKEQVFNSVKDMAAAVRQARKDFEEFGVTGSRSAKQVAREISLADAQVKDIQKSTKATNLNENFDNLAKSLTAVSAGFGVAQSAIALFSSDSEKASEAATTAQGALAFALGVSSLAQIKLGEKTIAATIALRAETAAANTSNVAMKALNKTIAANPVGALIVGITALVGVIYLLSDSITQAEKNQKALNDALLDAQKSTRSQVNEIRLLESIVTDYNKTEEQRLGAYTKLQKLIPSLNGLTMEQALAQDELSKATERYIKYAEAKAIVDVFGKKIAEEELKILEAKNKTSGETIKWYDEIVKVLAKGLIPISGEYVAQEYELSRATTIKNNTIRESNELIAALKPILEENAGIVTQFEGEEEANALAAKARAAALAKAEKDRAARLKEINAQLERQFQLEKDLLDQLAKRANLQFKFDEQIIKDAEAVLESQEELLKSLGIQFETPLMKLQRELRETYLSALPSNQVLDKSLEYFTEFWSGMQNMVKSGALIITGNLDDILKEFVKNSLKETEGLSEETISFIVDSQVKAFKAFVPESLQQQTVDYFNNLQQIVIQLEKLQATDAGLLVSIPKNVDTTQELINLTEYYANLIENRKELGLDEVQIQRMISERVVEQFGLKQLMLPLEEKGVKLSETEIAVRTKNNELVLQLAETIVTTITNQGLFNAELSVGAARLADIIKKIQEAREEQMALLREQAFPSFFNEFETAVKAGGESLDNFFKILSDNFEDLSKIFTPEQFASLFEALDNGLIDTTKLSKTQLLDLKNTLLKYQETFDQSIEDSGENIDSTIEKINKSLRKIKWQELGDAATKFLQEFTAALNSLDNILTEKAAFKLEKLTKTYERERAKITKTDEASNQKRLELEKEYQANKTAFEKKERIRSLKFSAVQTVANGAQAVIKALADLGPIAGGIAAGVTAALTIVQLDLINQQIQAAQSLRRGGLIRFAGGGYVQGLSHEYGGVKYQGGGIELEGKESIINRQSTLQYGGLLSQINQSGGGKPIVVETAMDSRLIEVLAKERNTPIRAYVIEQDITRAQAINKRLEELSTL